MIAAGTHALALERPHAAVAGEPTRRIDAEARIEALDVLRGFALCGIVLANVHLIGGAPLPLAMEAAPLSERIASGSTKLLVVGSFYPIFALLFGLGFALQLQRAEAAGRAWLGPYLRRLAVLLAIGIAHWLLIWDATILISYALLGVPLVLFRRLPAAVLVAAAVLAIGSQALAPKLTGRAERVLTAQPVVGEIMRQQAATTAAAQRSTAERRAQLQAGTYGAIVAERANTFVRRFSRPRQYYPWVYGSIFGMFLLGIAVSRSPALRQPAAHRARLWRLLGGGLLAGLAFKAGALAIESFAYPGWGTRLHLAGEALRLFGGALLGVGYAAGVLLACSARRTAGALRRLAPVGRMALTNYLLQSFLCAGLFYGYGLGLYGRVGVVGGLLIAVPIALVQLPLSAWWLARFRYGPAEWLWRSLARGVPQPMRPKAVRA